MILKRGPHFEPRESRSLEIAAIVLRHGKRNYALKKAGLMAIVCPVGDGSDVTGVSIFNTDVEETKRVMETDPGVQAGVFTFEIHPTESFPGDRLP